MSTPSNIAGRWALVTGAGRGIGRAIALCLAKEGCKVALASRGKEQLDGVAEECKAAGAPETRVYPCDLSTPAGAEDLASQVLRDCGGVEVLVNNAGSMSQGNPLEGDPDEWDKMMNLNLNSPMRLTRRLTPKMAENMSGYVFNLGSIASIEPMSGMAGAYAAAKHGIRGWSISSYLTLRHKNIKCVLINPAFVNTDLVAGMADKVIPERMIQPQDIADSVSFVLHTTSGCCPEEITLRLTLSAFK